MALRYFNVFGPRQDPLSQYAAVVPNFITAALDGSEPVVFGDGEQSRDFTYIDNVVEANVRAMHAEEVAGGTFNVAAGDRTSLNRLTELIGEITGRPLSPRHEPPRAGDVRHSEADVSRAERQPATARPSRSKRACGGRSPPTARRAVNPRAEATSGE